LDNFSWIERHNNGFIANPDVEEEVVDDRCIENSREGDIHW